MVTLTLLEPLHQTPLQQWTFEGEPVIRVGRSGDNHVVLNDSLVSRHHLELRRDGGSWQLVSQGTNGTFVNGVFVTHCLIPDNSLVQLAQSGPLLKFQAEVMATPSTRAPSNNTSNNTCNHEGNAPGNLFCIHCGQPLNVQLTVRQYQVLKTLGQGGMGTTFLAWDPTGRVATLSGKPPGTRLMFVLKQMNADMAKIAKARELFEREANTLKSLNHPGIPKYYDFFVENGKKYLAMELVHGQDLEKMIYSKGPVTPNQAIAWMIQTCDILDYLHSQDPPLIHRDIKPANLMARSYDKSIVVLDFGAVKEIGTTPGTRIGAEGYCAPEQERGQPVTQSDLYAIGPTLIFLLSGENPFKYYRPHGKTYRFDVSKIPTITPKLREVIERVTEPASRDRYQTAKELAAGLSGCL